jgi:hypothetical protein
LRLVLSVIIVVIIRLSRHIRGRIFDGIDDHQDRGNFSDSVSRLSRIRSGSQTNCETPAPMTGNQLKLRSRGVNNAYAD